MTPEERAKLTEAEQKKLCFARWLYERVGSHRRIQLETPGSQLNRKKRPSAAPKYWHNRWTEMYGDDYKEYILEQNRKLKEAA